MIDIEEIHSFSGQNEIITINNGLIIVTENTGKFIGGGISFKAEESTDIKKVY